MLVVAKHADERGDDQSNAREDNVQWHGELLCARDAKERNEHTFLFEGFEYGLVVPRNLSLAKHSQTGRLSGVKTDDYTIAVASFLPDHSRRVVHSPAQRRSLLAIRVLLSGSFSQGETYSPTDSLAILQRYWVDGVPWTLNRWFAAVSRDQFSLNLDLDQDGAPDMTEVVLVSADVFGGDVESDASGCRNIRNAVQRKLVGTRFEIGMWQHVVYVGPPGWGCGGGVGTVGGTSNWVAMAGHNLNVLVHEIGHNVGLVHSGAPNSGVRYEYGDTSCQMGSSYSDVYKRKGFNALQLWRWGVLDAPRTQEIASTSTNWAGLLYTVYEDEPGRIPLTKIIYLGPSGGPFQRYFLSVRSAVDLGVDRQVNIDPSPYVAPSFVGRVLVHYYEIDGGDSGSNSAIDDHQTTLRDFIDPGSPKTIGGFAVNVAWCVETHCAVRIGPSAPAAPTQPSGVPTQRKLVEFNLETTIPMDASSTVEIGTAEQRTDRTVPFFNSNSLSLFRQSGIEVESFIRMPVAIPEGSIIAFAELVLEGSFNTDGVLEFQNSASSMLNVSISIEQTVAPNALNVGNLRTRNWGTAVVRSIVGEVRGGDGETRLDITEIIRNHFANWPTSRYVALRLARGGASAVNYSFASARFAARRQYYAGPRIQARYAPYAELLCRQSKSLETLVACISGQIPLTTFAEPSASMRSDWKLVIASMLAFPKICSYDMAATSLDGIVELRKFDDESLPSFSFCLLMETRDSDADGKVDFGLGAFIVSPNATREISHQAPHPISDLTTETQAVGVFKATRSRSFLMAGARRDASATTSSCQSSSVISDVAHNVNNMFHATNEQILVSAPTTTVIQWHGMAATSCSGVDVYLSHGRNVVPQSNDPIEALRQALAAAQPTWSVATPGTNACSLTGTTNTQGRLFNGVASGSVCSVAASSYTGRWLHIEQSPSFRRPSDWLVAFSSAFPVPFPNVPTVSISGGSGLKALQWSSDIRAASFRVYRSLSASTGPFTMVVDSGKSRYLDLGLEEGQYVFYRVSAVSFNGVETAPSTVVASGRAPKIPIQVSCVAWTSTQIRVSWDYSNPVGQYTRVQVLYSENGVNFFLRSVNGNPPAKSSIFSRRTPGETTSFEVRAQNLYGSSLYSETISCQPGPYQPTTSTLSTASTTTTAKPTTKTTTTLATTTSTAKPTTKTTTTLATTTSTAKPTASTTSTAEPTTKSTTTLASTTFSAEPTTDTASSTQTTTASTTSKPTTKSTTSSVASTGSSAMSSKTMATTSASTSSETSATSTSPSSTPVTGSSTDSTDLSSTESTSDAGGVTPGLPTTVPTTSNCVFDSVPDGMIPWTLRLDLDFAAFDCPLFKSQLASDMEISVADLFFTSCVSGSVLLEGASSQAHIDAYATRIAASEHSLPVLSFSGVPQSSPTVPADEFPVVIVAAAAGGAVLLLIVILVICCACRARRKAIEDARFAVEVQHQARGPQHNPSFQSGNADPVPPSNLPPMMAYRPQPVPNARNPSFSSQFDNQKMSIPVAPPGSGY